MVHVAGFSLKFFILNTGLSYASENRHLGTELEGTQKKTKDFYSWICDLPHFAVLCVLQYVTRIV